MEECFLCKNQNAKSSLEHEKNMIYKYYSFNQNTLSCLINNELWLSHSSEFNDPFDCKYEIENSSVENFSNKTENLQEKDAINRLEEDNVNEHVKEIFRCINKTTFLTCFSCKKDNVLMWAHYANSHKGICIGYKIKKQVVEEPQYKIKIEAVDYSCTIPKIATADAKELSSMYYKNIQIGNMKMKSD